MGSHVPIQTIHLFPLLDAKLIELLRSLSKDDWTKSTRARLWRVKDIVTHLLDGNIRTLSTSRDKYFGEAPPSSKTYQELVNYLNKLNADWVSATKRMSPDVLINLLESTGKEYCAHLQSLDPFDNAMFSVAWAGEDHSKNWFHIAREYTEKWHHQQQIREAVGASLEFGQSIMTMEFYEPLINTFMQALPHTYRNIHPEHNCVLDVQVTTNPITHWFLQYSEKKWEFRKAQPAEINCTITLDPNTAWRLSTKGLSMSEAEKLVEIKGDHELGKPILAMLAVMA